MSEYKRPKILQGTTRKIKCGCGNVYITVNRGKEGITELFITLGHTGQCGASQMEAIGRCVSIGLQYDISPDVYVKQLKGIRCPCPIMGDGDEVLSCSDAIAKVLEQETQNEKLTSNTTRKP